MKDLLIIGGVCFGAQTRHKSSLRSIFGWRHAQVATCRGISINYWLWARMTPTMAISSRKAVVQIKFERLHIAYPMSEEKAIVHRLTYKYRGTNLLENKRGVSCQRIRILCFVWFTFFVLIPICTCSTPEKGNMDLPPCFGWKLCMKSIYVMIKTLVSLKP